MGAMQPHPRTLVKYETETGKCPYDDWLQNIRDKKARAIIDARLLRVIQGNFGTCRPVGTAVQEFKIYYGPGFRIYFAEDGDEIVLLLCGGDKGSQTSDIKAAKKYWKDYRS